MTTVVPHLYKTTNSAREKSPNKRGGVSWGRQTIY